MTQIIITFVAVAAVTVWWWLALPDGEQLFSAWLAAQEARDVVVMLFGVIFTAVALAGLLFSGKEGDD